VARVDGRRLSFEELGIYNGVFVMRDQQTGSLWSHFTGEAFEGELSGKRLEWIALERTDWARLKSTHPTATTPVKSALRFRPIPPMRTRSGALGSFLPANFEPTLPKGLSRKSIHEHGVGVAVGSAHKFSPLEGLGKVPVINDTVAKVPLVVLIQDGSASAAVYSRCVAGQTLRFGPAEIEGFAALKDEQTGTIWGADGSAVSGPLEGKSLTPVRSIITDWYGWGAYFPDSEVHGSPRR